MTKKPDMLPFTTADLLFQTIRLPHKDADGKVAFFLLPTVRGVGVYASPFGEYAFPLEESPELVAGLESLVGVERTWEETPDWVRDEYVEPDGSVLLEEEYLLRFA